ncbi:MAG TPA: S41 family peptidase [Bryobacteraceae bacterium]|nr:S41 family peptidase [Bryobacteraceae bacterium]
MDAVDDATFESTVSRMLAEVGTSGLGLLGKDTKVNSRNSINASFKSVTTSDNGTRWVFQDVLPGGVASRAGVQTADVLLSVNALDIVPPNAPIFAIGASTPMVISRNGDRKELNITLHSRPPKYRDNPYAEPQSVKASLGSQAVGNLKISLFPGKIGIDFANQVDSVFAGELAGAERLIIDLRGNPGGGIGGLRLMSYLTPARQPIGYSLDRRMVERGEKPDQLPRFGKIPKSKLEIPLLALKYGGKKSVALETEGLGAKRFHGRIVLLVNEHSTGAAEMVAQFAKENALAKIVGTKTPGRLVSRSAFPVGMNYQITIPVAAYVSWNGTRVEGKGIEPDVPVDWSYPEALTGVDNQLQRAVAIALAM